MRIWTFQYLDVAMTICPVDQSIAVCQGLQMDMANMDPGMPVYPDLQRDMLNEGLEFQ